MSESLSIPRVTTTPKPFGVNVEWKWPESQMWFLSLELQYLREDGRFEKKRIYWPTASHLISGLKSGERLQVRLRPVAVDGTAREWLAADWIDCISSVNTEEILQALGDEIHNSDAFKVLGGGWSCEKTGTLIINNGQVFINDAKIGGGICSTNYSLKAGVDYGEKQHSAGMAIGVEGKQRKVEFKADRFKVHEAASSIIKNAVATSAKTKIRLGDEMKQAVIDAVRESDLFASLQAGIDAQTASVAGLQQAMHDAVNDAIRNALKPGGLLYRR